MRVMMLSRLLLAGCLAHVETSALTRLDVLPWPAIAGSRCDPGPRVKIPTRASGRWRGTVRLGVVLAGKAWHGGTG